MPERRGRLGSSLAATIQVRTSKGDPICCSNEATECTQQKHRKLQQDPARVADVGYYMAGLENSKGGIDGVKASYFNEKDLKKQRASNLKEALEVLSPLSQKQLSETSGATDPRSSAVSFDTSVSGTPATCIPPPRRAPSTGKTTNLRVQTQASTLSDSNAAEGNARGHKPPRRAKVPKKDETTEDPLVAGLQHWNQVLKARFDSLMTIVESKKRNAPVYICNKKGNHHWPQYHAVSPGWQVGLFKESRVFMKPFQVFLAPSIKCSPSASRLTIGWPHSWCKL
jgi:hypothetical protein